jgi:hypothetical protein
MKCGKHTALSHFNNKSKKDYFINQRVLPIDNIIASDVLKSIAIEFSIIRVIIKFWKDLFFNNLFYFIADHK